MGIFDRTTDLFSNYRATIQFRDRVMGGIPKDPKIIEAWMRTKTGIDDKEELRRAMFRTLSEQGIDVTDMTYEQALTASESLAGMQSCNGFKSGEHGLYLESRVVKSMLKECTNILFAGKRWGATKKGPKSFLAERAHISPDKLWLGTHEPDGVELFIGHTNGPKGPQSNLTRYEFVREARLTFYVRVIHDEVPHEAWPDLWVTAQENGLGALRSQGHGRFDILEWDKCSYDDFASASIGESSRLILR